MKKNVLTICVIFISFCAFSQVSISGKVVDENNNPIPYVNILFKNTTIGTTTDDNGLFNLRNNNKYASVLVSSLGFVNKVINLKKKNLKNLNIILKEEESVLEEIIIVKKPKKRLRKRENPAYRILKEIWKNKKKNGVKQTKTYQYEKYTSEELGFGNMDSVFLKKVLSKKYDKLIDITSLNYENNTYSVPIELVEKSEKIYGNNLLEKERVDIEGERNIGLHQFGKYVERAKTVFSEIDIYKDQILILNKGFISPIATNGFGSYDYVLSDSIIENKKKQYIIHFFPRQKGDLVFKGHFRVMDKTFAISKIEMKILKDINLNFVRDLEFSKTFKVKSDGIYLPEFNEYKGEFTFLTKNKEEKSIYLIKREKYTDYKFDINKGASFYDKRTEQITANQFKKDASYWDLKQSEELKNASLLVNTVKKSRKMKSLTGAIYTLSDGWFTPFTGVQLGNIFTTTASNDVEGIRLRLGFRTFKSINDRFRFEGFGAYGFKDKKFKYGLEARYLLSQNPRIVVGLAHLDDTQQMGLTKFKEYQLLPQPDKGPKAAFNRGDNFFLSRIKESMLGLDIEVAKNFNVGLKLSYAKIRTADTKRFSLDFLDKPNGKLKYLTKDFTSDFYVSYNPGREVTGFGVDRKIGMKLHPKILLNYRKSYENVFGSNTDYSRLQLLYNHPISLGKLGVFDPTIIASKTFGRTPLSITTAISSNQTYFLTPNTFALLDYYDFVTDQHIEGHFEQHFNGLIMNRIPLVKKLNLRSILTFRAVYGSISNKHKEIDRSNILYVAPDKKPYYEYGVGIENIGYGNLRPLRVDFIWRSDFTNFNGLVSPKFGVRVGFKTSF
ncbi:DUF5686 family protein [Tenacibaculum sp.]|nr:DUF5686 family protein [Tenacibaculum sp.]